VKQVFAGDAESLHAGEPSPLRTVLGDYSLLAIDEKRHLEQRKLILPPFHGERMKVYESIVEEEALREIEGWPQGRSFGVGDSTMRITLNVILRAVFGVRESALMDQMRRDIPAAIRLGQRLAILQPLQLDLGPLSPWGRFQAYRQRFAWAINSLIDEARADPSGEERTDVLSMLAHATHEDDDSLLSDAEIADQLMTVVAAGHETTATTLAWAVERLRRHPAILNRMVAEALGGDEHEYRDAVIREIQRTRPVIPGCGRLTMKPFELGDYLLPKGTAILLTTALLHNNEDVYPNPRRFDPDRFVGVRPNPYAWLPFGGGIRRCPGAAFAHMEMDIVLRTMLRNVELITTKERDERWSFRGVAFVPANDGQAVIRRRVAGARSVPQAAGTLKAVA
jgi:cytochrome P450